MHMNKLAILGCVLLLLALGVAGYQLHQLQQQVADLQSQTAKLREIAERPPTQYVDVFPDNMSRITRLVSEAKAKLTIVGDFCAYGHYSNPSAYGNYFDAIKKLAEANVGVEMYLYDDAVYKKATDSQLGTDFNTLKNSIRFKRYFEFHPKTTRPNNMKEFRALMDSEQNKCVEALSEAGVRVHKNISIMLPIFMWMRDADEAIFSMYNLGDRAREVSLVTKDRSLINMLDEIATQARQRQSESQNHEPMLAAEKQ
jgi:hypothetical protein